MISTVSGWQVNREHLTAVATSTDCSRPWPGTLRVEVHQHLVHDERQRRPSFRELLSKTEPHAQVQLLDGPCAEVGSVYADLVLVQGLKNAIASDQVLVATRRDPLEQRRGP